MAAARHRQQFCVNEPPFTILILALIAACYFAPASSRLQNISPSNGASPKNPIDTVADYGSPAGGRKAGPLSDLVARKARAVQTRRRALVLLRELRSLNDSIAGANEKIREALAAREKLKVTSARMEEQRKVIDELSAIIEKTATRMYEQRDAESEEARLSLVTAGEAKVAAERLVGRVARRVMRLRDKAESYSIAVTCRDEVVKAFEQRLPQVIEAEKKAEEALRNYSAAWKEAMKSFPERDVLRIVESSSSTGRESTPSAFKLGSVADRQTRQATNRKVPLMSNIDDPYLAEIDESHGGTMELEGEPEADSGFREKQQKLMDSRVAVEEVAAADAEEAVVRGLLGSLRADIEAWKSSIAEVRASEDLQKLKRLRQELENAGGDAQFADFQVKESEKDLQQARALVAETMEMVEEQKRILQEAEQALAQAMAVESESHTLRARMQREEAELVKVQAERVASAMGRKMKRAELLVVERTQALRDAQMEREKAAKKVAELEASVKELGEQYGRAELTAKEAVSLIKLLKPIVAAKHSEAHTARRAWGKFLSLENVLRYR
ncbi:hypothetical protein CLOM_g7178 [Closterium sp. NIES-68]|nr:hypothetical protein CLOM_g7178 [Closterium sp. NIES-68]